MEKWKDREMGRWGDGEIERRKERGMGKNG
jgi:hypothetical protein